MARGLGGIGRTGTAAAAAAGDHANAPAVGAKKGPLEAKPSAPASRERADMNKGRLQASTPNQTCARLFAAILPRTSPQRRSQCPVWDERHQRSVQSIPRMGRNSPRFAETTSVADEADGGGCSLPNEAGRPAPATPNTPAHLQLYMYNVSPPSGHPHARARGHASTVRVLLPRSCLRATDRLSGTEF